MAPQKQKTIEASVSQTIAKVGVTDSKDLLMVSLAKFYSTKSHMQQIIPIIEGKSDISLRLIDWFVTNFSKKNITIITSVIDNNLVHFNVYLNYRLQLKAYSKQQFDPFRRRDRIKFYYEKEKWIETTIGQLNFFRWVLQNKILDYIVSNMEKIESDMISSQKDSQTKGQVSTSSAPTRTKTAGDTKAPGPAMCDSKKKRVELSKSFVKNVNHYHGARKVSFD